MKSVDLAIAGVVAAIVGWFMFDNKGFVTRVLLDATVFGNRGWDSGDVQKIGLIGLIGIGALIVGAILAIVGFRDDMAKKQK